MTDATAAPTETPAETPPEAPANVEDTTQGQQPGTENPAGKDENAGKEDGEKPSVPEAYEFTAPEGFEVSKDDLAGYEQVAKDAGLTQEQFAAVTKHGLEFFQKALGEQADAFAARSHGWQSAVLGDKTLSDGDKLLPEVGANVSRVIEQFGGDALKDALNETGAGNHPAIVQLFNNIGKALGAPSGLDRGKPSASTERDRSFEGMAARLYGNND